MIITKAEIEAVLPGVLDDAASQKERAHFARLSPEFVREIAALALEALSSREAGWQGIETAPSGKLLMFWAATQVKDGVVKNWKMAVGSFRYGMTFAEASAPDNIDGLTYINWDGETLKPGRSMPTHWRPLPTPPNQGSK